MDGWGWCLRQSRHMGCHFFLVYRALTDPLHKHTDEVLAGLGVREDSVVALCVSLSGF